MYNVSEWSVGTSELACLMSNACRDVKLLLAQCINETTWLGLRYTTAFLRSSARCKVQIVTERVQNVTERVQQSSLASLCLILYLPNLIQAVDILILYTLIPWFYRILFFSFACRSVIGRNVRDRKYGLYNDGAGQSVLNSRKIDNFSLCSGPVRSGQPYHLILIYIYYMF